MSTKIADALVLYTETTYNNNCPVDDVMKMEFLDTKFASHLMKQYSKFIKLAQKDRHRYEFPPELLEYFSDDGALIEYERVYFPFNIEKHHWVVVCVSIAESTVYVLDCFLSYRSESLIKKDMHPIAVMMPFLLNQISARDVKPFAVEKSRGVPQNGIQVDSGLTSILLMQAHAVDGIERCKSIVDCPGNPLI